jgi:CO/xanthine dehydrogenase Mo-binding subunit
MDVIGKSIQRKDAPDKVMGAVKYNPDYISPELLHARLVTSTYAHARIVSIDTAEAQKSPGVRAIVTGEYCPGLVGVLLEDHPILARGKVRYHGEPIAVVVADSEYEAKKAAELVKVEYEPLPVVNSPTEAMKPGAPLVHENLGGYRRLKHVYPEPGTNVANHVKIRKGDMGKGWAQCDVTVEAGFTVPQSDHVAMEQRNARCEIKPDGRVIVHTTSQSPFIVKKFLARYFNLQEGRVIVITPPVGGAFGGKAAVQLEFIVYLASFAVGGKTVKLVNTREEDMITSPCKIGLEARVKLGSTNDGTIRAAELTYLVDGGAYSNMGVGITKSMAEDCTGPYKIDNVWCDAICAYTNHPFTTSFRGFGHMEYTFAIERAMDMLAQKLNMDPLELRLKNAISPGDTTPTLAGLTASNIGNLKQCLNKLREITSWDGTMRTDLGNGRVRAMGISCFWKTSATPTDAVSSAILLFNPDGTIDMNIGPSELGPGTKTVLAQILAERLKMDVNLVNVSMEVSTELNPVHWKTVASMTVFMAGRAVLEAAEDAILQLKSIGAIVLRCPPSDLDVANGSIYIKDDPNQHLDITEVVHGYKYSNGNAIGGQIIGRGTFIMRHLSPLDKDTGKGIPGPGWTVGAQAVEVEFDTRDCTYRILKGVTVIDAGKVLHPKAAEGVVMGGMNMGLSFASREYFAYNSEGIIQNHNLRTYKVMRFGETPEYQVYFVETPQIDAPYGARGIGEHGDLGMPAALGNSLSAACGAGLNRLPLTPENIWRTRKDGKS